MSRYLAGSGIAAQAASDADTESCRELDALAAMSRLNLRLERDESAPAPWAVWDESEIIGAGESASEAVEDARRQVRRWEEAARG